MPRSNSNSSRSLSKSVKTRSVSPKKTEYTPSIDTKNIQTNTQPVNSHIVHKVENPSFLSNVVQGFAWGTGTSIARNIFENKESSHSTQPVVIKEEVNKTENCKEYNLCKKMIEQENISSYECYSKMNQKEYANCKE